MFGAALALSAVVEQGAAQVSLPPATAYLAAPPDHSPGTSRWFGRVGALRALFDSSAKISSNGKLLPAATAGVTDAMTMTFDIGYDLSDNVSVMFMGGIPPHARVIGRGSVSSFGELGRVWFGPATLTVVRHLPAWHGFSAYFGVGGAHLFILKAEDRSVTHLKVHDHNGLVFQAGVEYRLNPKWALYVDYKHIWLNVNAEGFLAGDPVRARITLNPDLISTGIKFRFG